MENLREYIYEDLLALVTSMGEKSYRAVQLYTWLYRKAASDIDSMTDVSKAFRERLKQDYTITGLPIVGVKRSADGTRKFVSELSDGARIESVLIPEEGRLTLCVSTQAGCAMGCRFCMTGSTGFMRDLTLSEMTGQLFGARDLYEEGEKITNIVLMGMGEPLANFDNVARFLKVLTDPKGVGISHNKVTVSTAGLVPGIKRLGSETNVNLAVSLNAVSDEVRSRLMPINRKYPIQELLSALRSYSAGGKKYITIEYVLIKDVNDSLEEAATLSRMLRGIKCKINVIPFNPFPGAHFKRPDEKRALAFGKVLVDSGYVVVTRFSKGADIQAACGQLRGSFEGAQEDEGGMKKD